MSQELRISTPVILASASPRRRELIQLGFSQVRICPSKAEEVIPVDLKAAEVAPFLATLKAKDIAASHPDTPVIGCDTVVLMGDTILTKPKDRQDAIGILQSLSGKEHSVCTGCCICYQGRSRTFSEMTTVRFWELTDEQIQNYVDTNEPMDKAGAYGIQALGSLLVREIRGDYFNVVGLPISRLYREFSAFVPQV